MTDLYRLTLIQAEPPFRHSPRVSQRKAKTVPRHRSKISQRQAETPLRLRPRVSQRHAGTLTRHAETLTRHAGTLTRHRTVEAFRDRLRLHSDTGTEYPRHWDRLLGFGPIVHA